MISSHILHALQCFLEPEESRMAKQWQMIEKFSPEDFDRLYQILLEHGLLGFYDWVINQHGVRKFHSLAFLKSIQRGISAQWTTNMHLAALQDWLSDLWAAQGLKFLVLKGLPLSERLYQNALIRPSSDVDILVHPQDWQRVLQEIKNHGFRGKNDRLNVSFQKNHFHLQFLCDLFPGILELHWNLTDRRFQIEVNEVFARLRAEEVSNRKLWVMDPTDELLYLSNHHATHYVLYRWLYLLDIARFIQVFGEKIQWSDLSYRMKKWRMTKTLPVSLSYVRLFFPHVWNKAVKEKVEEFLNENALKTMDQRVVRLLCDPKRPFDSRIQSSKTYRKLLAFILIDGSRKRLQSLMSRWTFI